MSNPAAPTSQHHFNLGQLFGFALLGLQAYAEQNQPGSGPSIFLQPGVVASYMQGVAAVLAAGNPTPPAGGGLGSAAA